MTTYVDRDKTLEEIAQHFERMEGVNYWPDEIAGYARQFTPSDDCLLKVPDTEAKLRILISGLADISVIYEGFDITRQRVVQEFSREFIPMILALSAEHKRYKRISSIEGWREDMSVDDKYQEIMDEFNDDYFDVVAGLFDERERAEKAEARVRELEQSIAASADRLRCGDGGVAQYGAAGRAGDGNTDFLLGGYRISDD